VSTRNAPFPSYGAIPRSRYEQRALVHALLLTFLALERALTATETRWAAAREEGRVAGASATLRATRRQLHASEALLRACLADLREGGAN